MKIEKDGFVFLTNYVWYKVSKKTTRLYQKSPPDFHESYPCACSTLLGSVVAFFSSKLLPRSLQPSNNGCGVPAVLVNDGILTKVYETNPIEVGIVYSPVYKTTN